MTGKMPVCSTDTMLAPPSSISIKFRSLLRVFPQEITGSIFLVSSRKALHFVDHLFYSKVFCEAQWPAAPDGKAGAENHPVIGILGRSHDFLFQAPRRFVHHQEHQPIRERLRCSRDR